MYTNNSSSICHFPKRKKLQSWQYLYRKFTCDVNLSFFYPIGKEFVLRFMLEANKNQWSKKKICKTAKPTYLKASQVFSRLIYFQHGSARHDITTNKTKNQKKKIRKLGRVRQRIRKRLREIIGISSIFLKHVCTHFYLS